MKTVFLSYSVNYFGKNLLNHDETNSLGGRVVALIATCFSYEKCLVNFKHNIQTFTYYRLKIMDL